MLTEFLALIIAIVAHDDLLVGQWRDQLDSGSLNPRLEETKKKPKAPEKTCQFYWRNKEMGVIFWIGSLGGTHGTENRLGTI